MIEVFRKELKYSISTVAFYRLRPMLDAVMRLDEYSGANGYEVRSLYFDSIRDDDLTDVLAGLLNKQKVRLRCYDTGAETFKLEYKCKTGTDSRKLSLSVPRRDAKRMISGRYEFLADMDALLASELYGRLITGVYLPRVVVVYRRIAYTSKLNDVRVTFDHEVGASLDAQALMNDKVVLVPVSATGSGVLEVKYNSFLPEYIKCALGGVNLSPTANSKYAQSRLIF